MWGGGRCGGELQAFTSRGKYCPRKKQFLGDLFFTIILRCKQKMNVSSLFFSFIKCLTAGSLLAYASCIIVLVRAGIRMWEAETREESSGGCQALGDV